MTNCNILIIALILGVVLVMAFADDIFITYPILLTLFTDQINFILLISLVILVLLIDLPIGIILSFIVLYLAVWVKQYLRGSTYERFTNITPSSTIPLSTIPLSHIPREYTSESEINYQKPPITPPSDLTVASTPQFQASAPCSNADESISKLEEPNRDGYDYTGCRYDMKNSRQNLTKWGPPLSRCNAYDKGKMASCGTLFYPLHA
jgi:hypothetical protein